jgi:parallel beta-helix repeat protein
VYEHTKVKKVEENLISDNTMFRNGYGIGLGKTSRTIVRSNRITGNTAPAFNAIDLFHDRAENDEPAGDPMFCMITGNILSGNSSNRINRGPGVSKEAWESSRVE